MMLLGIGGEAVEAFVLLQPCHARALTLANFANIPEPAED